MNFVIWLLKRIKRKMFGNDTFAFIEGYREFMRDEFAGCIIVTLLIGVGQFVLGAMLCAWIWDGSPPKYVFYILLANPFVFFFYNWLVNLYSIYDTERMAVWDELKR